MRISHTIDWLVLLILMALQLPNDVYWGIAGGLFWGLFFMPFVRRVEHEVRTQRENERRARIQRESEPTR